jgi:hypothetical protein
LTVLPHRLADLDGAIALLREQIRFVATHS